MNLPKSLQVKHALRSKVARRIFLLFILCALIPLSVLAYLSLSLVTRNLYSGANEELREATKASSMTIFERLLFLETDLTMMSASLPKGKEASLAYSVPGLRERLHDRFRGLALITGDGRAKYLQGKMPMLPQLGKDEQDFVHSGKTLLLSRTATDRSSRIYLVKALDSRRSSYELLAAEINPEYLWGGEGISSPMTQLFLIDSSGNVLFSSLPAYIPLQELKNVMKQNPSTGRFTWAYGGDSYLANYRTMFMVPPLHATWVFVQSQSSGDILAPIGNFRKLFALLVLLTFLIVVVLSLSQIRRSLIPIELLRQATQRITAKNFKSRVDIKTNDEFDELGRSFNEMASSLENYLEIMMTLNRVGIALSAEKNTNRLLEFVITGAKRITNADGCALYLVTGDGHLRLSFMEIDSRAPVAEGKDEVLIPLYDEEGKPNTRDAIVFSALKDTTVNIPDMHHSQEFTFPCNLHLDGKMGYRSLSLLNIPVKTHENEIVGVLQFINARHRLSGEIIPFSEEDQRLLETLASQAAVALSKNKLIEDFKKLFDSLVELIATAIDEKSPHTGDHCRRVPELTMMLAEAVSNENTGIFKDFTMSEDEQYELKVAALLHDCGKVTTPVHIVDKATRLEKIFDRIGVIDTRFEVLIRDAHIAFLQNQMVGGRKERDIESRLPEKITEQVSERDGLARYLAQIERDRAFITACNRGETVLDDTQKERAKDIAHKYRWINAHRQEEPVISKDELYALTSSEGTLTPAERKVINQHVETTIKMLEALSYPKVLRNVPLFARAHHERVNGKGYPKGLTREEIPVQGRILAIADIFEALTADRPYKKEKTLMEALCVLGLMKLEGQIDPDLFDIFIDEKVYLRYAQKYLSPAQIDEVVLSQIPGYAPPSR